MRSVLVAGVSCGVALATFDEEAVKSNIIAAAAAVGISLQRSNIFVTVQCIIVSVSASGGTGRRELQEGANQVVKLEVTVRVDVRVPSSPNSAVREGLELLQAFARSEHWRRLGRHD